MHAYSTDSRERRVIAFFIAAAAIAVSIGVALLLDRAGVRIPSWVSPLDAFTFYGLLYWFFDRVVWRWRWVHRCHVSRIPNLSGVWQGQVVTAKSENSASVNVAVPITLTIRQSWTRLSIQGRTSQSASRSLSAHIVVSEECTMSYEYLNEPTANATPAMHAHRGLATLALSGNTLRGEYFSGRDRQNIGTIEVARTPREVRP